MFFSGCSILPELKLRRIFPAKHFVNTKPPEKRIQVLFSKKEIRELPGDGPNILNKSNIDCYMERPSATFCNGKYSILSNFCYAEFLAYCILINNQTRPVNTSQRN